ncbi:MAG: hypothetical protein HW379_1594 [Actinobacteria bacterium]|jgi:hypothetical protein|nr:hypothetical protein [Actinomycetota bacterium]
MKIRKSALTGNNTHLARNDAINTAAIEGGQFYIMTISNWDTVFAG